MRKRRLRDAGLALFRSALGGAVSVVLGIGVTVGYTRVQHIALSVPAVLLAASVGAAHVVDARTGVSPAVRLARADGSQPS
jgi:hypothetical protein